MWEWFWYVLPWWGKLGIAVIVISPLFYFFPGLLKNRWTLPVLATIAAMIGANLLAQRGWEAKAKKDQKDADKLIKRAQDARAKADKLNADPKHLRDDDGFRRD